MKYKILNNLQFYYQEEVVVVEIPTKYINNAQEVPVLPSDTPHFLQVKTIEMKEDKCEITYHRPKEYTLLTDLKNYAAFYKLEILNELMMENVLDNTRTYLSMSNILVKTTKDIQLIYQADDKKQLPYHCLSELNQWKNFICEFFGSYSLSRYTKNREKLLAKEKKPFLDTVVACDTQEELKLFIQESLINEQKIFFANDYADKVARRQLIWKKRLGKTVLGLTCFGLYLGTIFYLNEEENKAVAQVQTQAATEIAILNKIIDEDSDSIAEDMEQLNYPIEKQVDIYVKLNDVAKAYELDPTADKRIIQNFYKQGETDEILNLDMPGSETLTTYQTILTYENAGDLDYIIQTTTDSAILEALIDQAVAHEDISRIRNIRTTALNQKGIEVRDKSRIKMLDTLLADNNYQLENIYKDDSVNEELKKSRTNDLLEENNRLLSEKIELQQKK